jgi:chromosome segregation ATPase
MKVALFSGNKIAELERENRRLREERDRAIEISAHVTQAWENVKEQLAAERKRVCELQAEIDELKKVNAALRQQQKTLGLEDTRIGLILSIVDQLTKKKPHLINSKTEGELAFFTREYVEEAISKHVRGVLSARKQKTEFHSIIELLAKLGALVPYRDGYQYVAKIDKKSVRGYAFRIGWMRWMKVQALKPTVVEEKKRTIFGG